MKVLADTSVWIDHFRRSEPHLGDLLVAGHIVTHTAVIGELACGSLRERDRVLQNLRCLATLPQPRGEEALHLVEHHRLWGRGLDWTGVLVLCSCRADGAMLWTRDRALQAAATKLGLAYSAPLPVGDAT